MAGIKAKYGNIDNQPLSEYVVTSEAEIEDLPTSTTSAKGKFADDVNFTNKPSIGSKCKVITSDGNLYLYMLTEKGWVKVKTSSGGSGSLPSDWEFVSKDDIDNLFN